MMARRGNEEQGNGHGRVKDARRLGHPIGVVSRRTAIPPDLLRAWEKRYQAVVPRRTDTGRRLYSDEDIERLRLMKALVEGRRRISDVAGLGLDELKSLVKEDEAEAITPPRTRPRTPVAKISQLLQDAMAGVAALDRRQVEQALGDAAIAYSPAQVRRDLLVPLLHQIGERWQEGTLRIAHEHMASSIVRSVLANFASRPTAAEDGPTVVATTTSGQRHEIGALLATAVAMEAGWQVLYLGPDLPAEEIAAAALQSGARAVMLSVIYPSGDPRTREQFRLLRRYLGDGFPIFAGGRATATYRDVIDEIDGIAVNDLTDLQGWLSSITH
jgi:methanogenic corrinoid protein MtbC1